MRTPPGPELRLQSEDTQMSRHPEPELAKTSRLSRQPLWKIL
jgi:hypothetical protein